MKRNSLLAQEIRNSTFGKPTRKPIIDSVNTKLDQCDKKMDEIEARHNERISSFTPEPISGQNDYFRLVVARVNGH